MKKEDRTGGSTGTWQTRAIIACVALLALGGCGGGGGGGGGSSGTPSTPPSSTPPESFAALPAYTSVAEQCAAPRPAGTIDPLSGQPYGDTQGSLTLEKEWIAGYVNATYLWYQDVAWVDPVPYVLGATVPYVDPSDNSAYTELLNSNYMVDDAYFNSQRSPLTTASGKPKDQFHFTYQTTVWDSLELSGTEAGFGFTPAIISADPPRSVVIAYVDPGTLAANNGLVRGDAFITVNGVDVANGSDYNTLNEGLFSPVAGTSYTFVVQDPGSSTTRTVTMTAANETETPVQDVQTLPAPNTSVGYMLFNEHIATAEGELISAINTLAAANGGAGVTDLVLDIRYNGGGLLDIASELAYMIAGPGPTTGKIFEEETFNNKNPFDFTSSQTITPFHTTTQGFSVTAGQALPSLNLTRVYVLTGAGTCSASEAIINSLIGVGVNVIQIGMTTCGKPYGFYPADNCGVTYFAIQFQGVNNAGFGAYADGFVPAGTGGTANDLPGCVAIDDFSKQLGDPNEARLATALYYRANGSCPSPALALARRQQAGTPVADAILKRDALHENRFFRNALIR
jgi:carboxyl-terminal processing protease